MRILIGYDGSECSEAALEDLQRAGLPTDVEAVVMTVADVWLWPEDETTSDSDVLGIERAREHARRALREARELAARASERLRSRFPEWKVATEAVGDSPAWALVKKADEWEPDLIVVGSHGRTAIERFVLGSVSQKVLYEARCSVRIARRALRPAEDTLRIIVGVDGSPSSQAALEMAAARAWPEGTEIRVLSAIDGALSLGESFALRWIARDDERAVEQARAQLAALIEPLFAGRGWSPTVIVRRGSAKRALVEEAEKWQADSVFVGARGLRTRERSSLGSVASVVASRAPCSVEVVRKERIASAGSTGAGLAL
ncbi:MAG: hypothetical protein C4334_10720 [Pyrinomonas sp.]|uniref:universal stress protein n=1 Tax=Pyrinomonas sp. TaxID=2080306 RepID=UPI0033218E36